MNVFIMIANDSPNVHTAMYSGYGGFLSAFTWIVCAWSNRKWDIVRFHNLLTSGVKGRCSFWRKESS